MYNNTIHYLCILIRIKQLYPRNFLTTLLFQLLFLISWNSEAVQYFSRIPRTSQNESYSIEQICTDFRKKSVVSIQSCSTPSSLDPSHSFSRIPDWKQRSVCRGRIWFKTRLVRADRKATDEGWPCRKDTREDTMKRRWRDGRARRLNEEFGALLAALQVLLPSKNHRIDLSLNRSNHRSYASRLRCLINAANAHCPQSPPRR